MTTNTTQPTAPAPAQGEALNDALAVFALLGGLFCGPLGILFGHLSNRAARAAGRKRSPLAVTGLVLGYAWVDLAVTFGLLFIYPAPAALLIPTVILAAVVALVNRRARA